MSHVDAFQTLKARYCLAAILIAWYWQPGSQTLAGILSGSEWYWSYVAFQYYAHGVIALFLIVAASISGLEVSRVTGRYLQRRDLPLILLIVTLTFCASMAINTIAFVPISYLFPDFVAWWLVWCYQPVVYLTANGTLPMGANVLGFISIVVLGPVLEEFLFRGYLLHRWSKKWGLWTGVLFSVRCIRIR